jgi:cytochrome c556
LSAAAAAMLLSGVAAGLAQDKLAIIKQRQDFMSAQGKDLQTIGKWGKGSADQKEAVAAIDDLLQRNAQIPDQFPPGTSADDFPGKSKAKADLWKDPGKVKELVADVKTAEEHLRTTVQSGDAKAAGAEASTVYRTNCNGCHNPYRLSDKS